MEIAVLLKQVPEIEAFIRIADDERSLITDHLQWIINPFDALAIEEGSSDKKRPRRKGDNLFGRQQTEH